MNLRARAHEGRNRTYENPQTLPGELDNQCQRQQRNNHGQEVDPPPRHVAPQTETQETGDQPDACCAKVEPEKQRKIPEHDRSFRIDLVLTFDLVANLTPFAGGEGWACIASSNAAAKLLFPVSLCWI